jgi:hypothetical protein
MINRIHLTLAQTSSYCAIQDAGTGRHITNITSLDLHLDPGAHLSAKFGIFTPFLREEPIAGAVYMKEEEAASDWDCDTGQPISSSAEGYPIFTFDRLA